MSNSQSDFQYSIDCRPDFSFLTVQLPKGATLKVEASAMATMDVNLTMKTKTKGGLSRLLTGESIFINEFSADGGPEFYAVEEGQIVVGDRQGLTASDTSSLDASSGSEERLVRLFSQFEATLRTSKEVGATDEETLEKLKALGYVP